jgi:hypothetical protein
LYICIYNGVGDIYKPSSRWCTDSAHVQCSFIVIVITISGRHAMHQTWTIQVKITLQDAITHCVLVCIWKFINKLSTFVLSCTTLNELSITVCKSILAIPRRASNTAALSELGVYPISRDIIVSMVKYWIWLKTLDNDRLLWHAFVEDNRIASHNSKLSWCASINQTLCALGLERYCNTDIHSAGTFIQVLYIVLKLIWTISLKYVCKQN